MYVKNNAITITWNFAPNSSPPPETDYDIQVIPGNLNQTYTEDGSTTYTAPTATTNGSLTYTFTPTTRGLFTINLSIGTDTITHDILDSVRIWVFDTNPAPSLTADTTHQGSTLRVPS